jgi:hypothetical protein
MTLIAIPLLVTKEIETGSAATLPIAAVDALSVSPSLRVSNTDDDSSEP